MHVELPCKPQYTIHMSDPPAYKTTKPRSQDKQSHMLTIPTLMLPHTKNTSDDHTQTSCNIIYNFMTHPTQIHMSTPQKIEHTFILRN